MADLVRPFGEVLTAMITPFDANGQVDYEVTARLANHLVDHGNDGLVVTGTTGESPTLTTDEKLAMYRVVLDAVGDRAHVIAGTGDYNTAHSVEMSQKAAAIGVHGLMAVTPYYSKPSQQGIEAHFTAIADSTDLPLIVYNIPGRTGRLVDHPTLERLAAHPNIVATKDAVDDIVFTSRSRQYLGDDVAIYCGSDIMTLPQLAVGAVGVISVLAHLAGDQIKAMVSAFHKGDTGEAERLHRGMVPLFDAGFMEPNPQPTKAGLTALWQDVGVPRLPLVAASDETTRTIVAATGQAQRL